MRSNSSINQGSSTGAQTERKRGGVPQHGSAVDLPREAPLQRRLCALLFPNAYRTSLNIAPFASHRKWKQKSAVADSQNTRGDPVEDELLRAMDLVADGRPGSS